MPDDALNAIETAIPILAAPIGGALAPAPYSFEFTGEDALRVTATNSVSGVRVSVHYRINRGPGASLASSASMAPTSDRLPTSQEFEIGVGYLLNLTVFASAGAPRIGQTFVKVEVIRGRGTSATVLGVIVQDYITASQPLGWPGSPIRSSFEGGGVIRTFNGTDPAVGAEIHETVPTGARWQLIALGATLACSAAAPVRRPTLVLAPGGAQVAFCPSNYDAPGGLSTIYPWAVGMTFSARVGSVQQSAGLPTEPLLVAGSSIDTQTLGIDAGDNWNAPTLVIREWLEAQ